MDLSATERDAFVDSVYEKAGALVTQMRETCSTPALAGAILVVALAIIAAQVDAFEDIRERTFDDISLAFIQTAAKMSAIKPN